MRTTGVSATVVDSTVNGNTAADAGWGIADDAGTTAVYGSAVSSNTALGESGAFGGGVFVTSGTVPLHNRTVSGNTPDNCEPLGFVAGCTG